VSRQAPLGPDRVVPCNTALVSWQELGSDFSRNNRSLPGIPRGPGSKAGRPVDRRDEQHGRPGHGSVERTRNQWQKTHRLQAGAEDDPALMRFQDSNGGWRDELQNAADQDGKAGHQTGKHIAHSDRQDEGLQVGFPTSHHDAIDDAIGDVQS